MGTRLVIDKAGRIALPQGVRDDLRLTPGDALEMESTGEQITLRPARDAVLLTKEKGIWVLRTGEPWDIDTDDLLRQIREERDLENLGEIE